MGRLSVIIPATAIIKFAPVLFPSCCKWFCWTNWCRCCWYCFRCIFPARKKIKEWYQISFVFTEYLLVKSVETVEDLFTLFTCNVTWRNTCIGRKRDLILYLVLDCCDLKHRSIDHGVQRFCCSGWSINKHWRILYKNSKSTIDKKDLISLTFESQFAWRGKKGDISGEWSTGEVFSYLIHHHRKPWRHDRRFFPNHVRWSQLEHLYRFVRWYTKPCINDGIPFCPYDYLCQLWQRIPGRVFRRLPVGYLHKWND